MEDKYKQALLNNTATIETKIDILPSVVGESVQTITNYNSVKDWTYKDFRYVEKQGFIGQFVARQLDGNLQDITDDFNIQDKEIVLWLGVRIDENDIGWYSLGNFLVSKPESNEVNDNTKFEALDYTIKFNPIFNGDYKDEEYTQSFNEIIASGNVVTALWLAQYTCKQCGVELGQNDFLNYNFEIASNQFDSEDTCRDVIKAIAQLGYTWARIGWDNKLYFDFVKQNTASETPIDNDHYYSLKTQKNQYGEVNRVLIGTSMITGDNEYVEDSESIEENGLTEIDIYDNPLTYTEELRRSVIESGRTLLGLKYNVLDMETVGHPWLQGNELIEVVNMEGNSLYTYPFDRTIKYTGHIKTQITSYANTDIESTYMKNTDIYIDVKRTRVELNKAEQYFQVEIENIDNKYETELNVSKHISAYPTSEDESIRNYPIHIEDAGAFNLEHEIVYGRTIQNGTPSSTNPITIQNVESTLTTRVHNGKEGEEEQINIVNHSLNNNFLGNIGNIRDTFDCSTGELIKRINRYAFDGSENWQLNTSDNTYITFYLEGTQESPLSIIRYDNRQGEDVRGISNYFPVVVGLDTTKENIGLTQDGQATKCVYLTIKKSTLDTPDIDGLKKWLRELYVDDNNEAVALQYIANDYVSSFLQYNSVTLFENVNNITFINTIEPYQVDIEYLTKAKLNGSYATRNQLQINKNNINAVLQETQTLRGNINDLANSTNDSISALTESLEATMSVAQVGFDFKQEVDTEGVKIVDTKTGIRLDKNGISVEKFDGGQSTGTKTVIDETGMNVYDTTGIDNTSVLQVDTKGVNSLNITTQSYLRIGDRSHFENYLDGTGCFFIGGSE